MKMLLKSLVAFLLISAASFSLGGEAREPVRPGLSRTNGVAAIKALPEQDRAVAMTALRSEMRAKESLAAQKRQARLVLLDLGDEETIRDTVKKSREDFIRTRQDMMDVLKESSQPRIIAELMKDVEREEDAQPRLYNAEFFDYPISVRASEAVCRILQNSTDIDQAVKTWAGRLSIRRPEELRDQVRRWWAANKGHMTNENFRVVKPPGN